MRIIDSKNNDGYQIDQITRYIFKKRFLQNLIKHISSFSFFFLLTFCLYLDLKCPFCMIRWDVPLLLSALTIKWITLKNRYLLCKINRPFRRKATDLLTEFRLSLYACMQVYLYMCVWECVLACLRTHLCVCVCVCVRLYKKILKKEYFVW